MDGAAGRETKLLRKTAIDGDGASIRPSVPPVEQQLQSAPPLPAAAGVAAGADASAAVQSCGEEEDDDKQVERFYALLANIRALRGLYSAGDGGGGSGSASAAGLGRKRARETEAAWRPAFRMEDFEEEEVSQGAGDARCAVEKQDACAGGVRRPAAGAAPPTTTEDDEVAAEARGRKLGRRVAAQACPLFVGPDS